MKTILGKIAGWVFITGLFATGAGLWDTYQKSGINSEPVTRTIADISAHKDKPTLVTIDGGFIDVTKSFEYGIGKEDQEELLGSYYFTPVVGENVDKAEYIIKSSEPPDLSARLKGVKHTGLLQSAENIPEKVSAAYKAEYPGSSFMFLDTIYKPRSPFKNLQSFSLFYFLLVLGLGLKSLLNRKPDAALQSENPV